MKISKTLKAINDFRGSKWFAAFLVCVLLGGFIILTAEVREARLGHIELIDRIDQACLNFFITHRTPTFNNIATAITLLGSVIFLSIIAALFCAFSIAKKRLADTAQFLLAAVGASLLTWLLKIYFERVRPENGFRLVEVDGFSYPSGHALSAAAIYFTINILVCRSINLPSYRAFVRCFFLSLIILVAITRLYLGVHFFSDVLAGILVGISWACLVEFLAIHRKSNLVH